LSGIETFADKDEYHRVVFFVDGDGKATRLACDPAPDPGFLQATAISPDAIYLTVNYFPTAGWTIVKVPRR
jgi:hypothetical protein